MEKYLLIDRQKVRIDEIRSSERIGQSVIIKTYDNKGYIVRSEDDAVLGHVMKVISDYLKQEFIEINKATCERL